MFDDTYVYSVLFPHAYHLAPILILGFLNIVDQRSISIAREGKISLGWCRNRHIAKGKRHCDLRDLGLDSVRACDILGICQFSFGLLIAQALATLHMGGLARKLFQSDERYD